MLVALLTIAQHWCCAYLVAAPAAYIITRLIFLDVLLYVSGCYIHRLSSLITQERALSLLSARMPAI